MPSDSIIMTLTATLLFLSFAGLLSTLVRIRRNRRADGEYLTFLKTRIRDLSARIASLEKAGQ